MRGDVRLNWNREKIEKIIIVSMLTVDIKEHNKGQRAWDFNWVFE